VISRLTTVELVSGLARRQREKAIDSVAFTKLRGAFLNNVDNFYIAINLYKEVLAEERDLTERYPLRAMDTVQLACALKAARILAAPIYFVTADARLLSAASAEGFAVDDPNAHP
jgi:predicted nucleic acid-binding protein